MIVMERPHAIQTSRPAGDKQYPEYEEYGKNRYFAIGDSLFLATRDHFYPGQWNLYVAVKSGYYQEIGKSVSWEDIIQEATLAIV